MQLRTLVSYVNLLILAVVIALVVLERAYTSDAVFYGLLAWMFVSMFLMYGPWGTRTVGGDGPSAALSSGSGPAAPGAAASAGTVPFCIFCAAPVPVGAVQCPSCGHRTARL